jgi:hypothetical protein
VKKVIKLTEKDIEGLVKKVIKEEKIQEALPRRERERHQTNWRKREFEPYDREKDIMGAFGPYSSDVPPNVISYLRKNPRTFLQRVVDIYGMDKVLDFIGYQQPEMAEGYDNYMDDFHESKKKNQKNKKLTPSDIKAKMDSLGLNDRRSNLRDYR